MLEKRNRRIATQVKSFLSPEKSDARLAEIADAQERFLVAAEENGIPRHELAAALPGIERRNGWAFYAMFLVKSQSAAPCLRSTSLRGGPSGGPSPEADHNRWVG